MKVWVLYTEYDHDDDRQVDVFPTWEKLQEAIKTWIKDILIEYKESPSKYDDIDDFDEMMVEFMDEHERYFVFYRECEL